MPGPKRQRPRRHGGPTHGQKGKNGKSGSHGKSHHHKGGGQQAGKHNQKSHETRYRHQSSTDHWQQNGSPSGQGHRRTDQVGGGQQHGRNAKKKQRHRGQSKHFPLPQPQQQQLKQQERELLSMVAYDAEDEIDVDESEDTPTDEDPQEVATDNKMEVDDNKMEEDHNLASGSKLPRLGHLLANQGLEILRTLLERRHRQGRQQQERQFQLSGNGPPKNQTWQAWVRKPRCETPWARHNCQIQECGAREWAQGQQRRLDEEQARLYTLSCEAEQMKSMIARAHEVYQQQQQQQPPQPHEARVPPPPTGSHLAPSPSPSPPPPPPSAATIPFQPPNTHLRSSPPPSTRPPSASANLFTQQQPTHRDKLLTLLDRTANLLTALHHSEELFMFRALNTATTATTTSNTPHLPSIAQQQRERERNAQLNELTAFFRSAEATVKRAGQRVQAALQRADAQSGRERPWAGAMRAAQEEREEREEREEMQFLAAWEGVVRVFGEEVWPVHGRIARRMGVERDGGVGRSEEWEAYGRVLGAWKGWVEGLGLGL